VPPSPLAQVLDRARLPGLLGLTIIWPGAGCGLALAAAKGIPGLRVLRLEGSVDPKRIDTEPRDRGDGLHAALGPADAVALAGWDGLEGVTSLALFDNEIGDAGVIALRAVAPLGAARGARPDSQRRRSRRAPSAPGIGVPSPTEAASSRRPIRSAASSRRRSSVPGPRRPRVSRHGLLVRVRPPRSRSGFARASFETGSVIGSTGRSGRK